MAMLVSVDLGYGYTKAVSEKGRAVFPSMLCPAPETPFDLAPGAKRPGHIVEFRGAGSLAGSRFFVGELAAREGRAVELTLARERFGREASVTLTAAAAGLVGAEGRTELAFGVPLAYYKAQREEVRRSLEGLGFYVRVDEGPERFIILRAVHVFPQGVGALFSAADLPEEGLVGLVDIGYFTTDHLLVELGREGAVPLPGFMSSIEVGVATALKLFADAFRDRTGRPLTLSEAQSLWARREVTFAGRRLDLEPHKAAARLAAGRAVAEAVYAAWAEKADFLDGVMLAGGGALEFLPVLRERFRALEVLPDPVFANALGFYRMAEKAVRVAEGRAETPGR
jgi:plasmid segregation protein ParM